MIIQYYIYGTQSAMDVERIPLEPKGFADASGCFFFFLPIVFIEETNKYCVM